METLLTILNTVMFDFRPIFYVLFLMKCFCKYHMNIVYMMGNVKNVRFRENVEILWTTMNTVFMNFRYILCVFL